MSSIYDWSKVAGNNSNSDSGINWLEGQLPGTVNNAARAMMGREAEFLGDIGGALTAGGTAIALTVTANSAFTTHANGLVIALRIATTNSGAATLNVNGLGAKSIRKMNKLGEAALIGGELQSTAIYWLMYSTALNSAAGGWLLLNPTLDYREDTFTPVVAGTSTAGTGTYTLQNGTATKMGSVVSFNLNVTWTAHTGTGNIRIDGLPFGAPSATTVSVFPSSLTFTGTLLLASIQAGTSSLFLSQVSSGTGISSVPMDTSAALTISGQYSTI